MNGFGNYPLVGSIEDLALPRNQRTLQRWFNVEVFNRVAAQQLVANVRTLPMRFDSVRLDNVNNVDLSLIKNVRFNRGVTAQFRLEALNAFNHPLFPGPSVNNVTAASFGQVVASTQANYARRVQVMAKIIF